jgi:NADPH:quinone reductase-like Zn-dependent oxidoreductase
MQAVVQERYGAADSLALEEIDHPEVGDNAVLVRVRAAAVNPADRHFMRGDPYLMRLQAGLRRPKTRVLGCDLAGQVEAVGKEVTTLRPGDDVFGCTFMRGFGAFAERARVAEDVLAPKPADLSFEHAAAVPTAALTALQGLRDHGGIEAGQRVLIIGASGGVGTFAVQIAKASGAEVTGVCSSRNVDLVRSLGADEVIDYTREDFVRGAARYDIVFQLAGTLSPMVLRRVLSREGTLLVSSGESDGRWIGPVGRTIAATLLSPFASQRLLGFTVKPNSDDLLHLRQLLEKGSVMPVIDRSYPLGEVPAAIRYLEEGHARGKVVITV